MTVELQVDQVLFIHQRHSTTFIVHEHRKLISSNRYKY